jgi:hypothetical protein
MLSEKERALLQQIEQQIKQEDPAFYAKCSAIMPTESRWWSVDRQQVSTALWAAFAVVSTGVLVARRQGILRKPTK